MRFGLVGERTCLDLKSPDWRRPGSSSSNSLSPMPPFSPRLSFVEVREKVRVRLRILYMPSSPTSLPDEVARVILCPLCVPLFTAVLPPTTSALSLESVA